MPEARLAEAERHYLHFGGRSPLNERNRALVAAVSRRLDASGTRVYLGNRHSAPRVDDALASMQRDGVRRAVAFVTSAFDSPAGFTRYLEDVERARAEMGPSAPAVDALPPFFDRPEFVAAQADLLGAALRRVFWGRPQVLFTAHSIPRDMARACPYESQLHWACARVASAAGVGEWSLAFQSRSGPPAQPWLGPDVAAALVAARERAAEAVVVVPLGFVSEHMEVCWDLDVEAAEVAHGLGLDFVRASTLDEHPAFVEMVVSMARGALLAA